MTALTLYCPKLDRRTALRGIGGGTIWGVSVATALLGFSYYQCGAICLGQIIDTTVMSVAIGIVTIGPLALLRREA